jgi:hypothetical protein
MNSIETPHFDEPICWLTISEDMRDLSSRLRKNQTIKDDIIKIFHHLFHISHRYDLDMNKAWEKWHKKAKTKKYDHSGS